MDQNASASSLIDLSALESAHSDILMRISSLMSAPEARFKSAYCELADKLDMEFRMEEQWMEKIGFPALNVHREHHARALSAVHHARSGVMAGDFQAGRDVVRLLSEWFEFHVSTMDAALVGALEPNLISPTL